MTVAKKGGKRLEKPGTEGTSGISLSKAGWEKTSLTFKGLTLGRFSSYTSSSRYLMSGYQAVHL